MENPILEKFRRAQRLAYDCVVSVGGALQQGISEKEAAVLLEQDLRSRGIRDWFHRPFAWFGERSAFHGMRGYRDFLPSDRRLREEDVVILDVSPIVDGCIGDVGYTTSLKPHPGLDGAMAKLRELRARIPVLFSNGMSLGEIWRDVDGDLKRSGYENSYARYPFSVLGHHVAELPSRKRFGPSLPVSHLSWFGKSAYLFFLRNGIFPLLLRRNSRQPKDGIWAIEPHLGTPSFGAKFEEILIVRDGKAFWLDDDVPHLK